MSDEQIKSLTNSPYAEQLLKTKEHIQSLMSSEAFEHHMMIQKSDIQAIIDQKPGTNPLSAASALVDVLDADMMLAVNERELWKALLVIAAFEMQEIPNANGDKPQN